MPKAKASNANKNTKQPKPLRDVLQTGTSTEESAGSYPEICKTLREFIQETFQEPPPTPQDADRFKEMQAFLHTHANYLANYLGFSTETGVDDIQLVIRTLAAELRQGTEHTKQAVWEVNMEELRNLVRVLHELAMQHDKSGSCSAAQAWIRKMAVDSGAWDRACQIIRWALRCDYYNALARIDNSLPVHIKLPAAFSSDLRVLRLERGGLAGYASDLLDSQDAWFPGQDPVFDMEEFEDME